MNLQLHTTPGRRQYSHNIVTRVIFLLFFLAIPLLTSCSDKEGLSRQDEIISQLKHGLNYIHSHDGEEEEAMGRNLVREAIGRGAEEIAERGNVEAQYYIGVCYYYGDGVRSNFAKAAKWYRLAAEQGHAKAMVELGDCYSNGGRGVDKDYAEAVKWYRKAAKQGFAEAQVELAWCYLRGEGVKKSRAKAIKWFRRAAEQGDKGAQRQLARRYRDGEDVKKNPAEAAKWWRKAAEQEDADAQYELGECYRKGDGVKKDPEQAVKWYLKAAEEGWKCPSALFKLGDCYRYGEGVPKDYDEAAKWYRKCVERGDNSAKEALEEMREEAQAAELEEEFEQEETSGQNATSVQVEPTRDAYIGQRSPTPSELLSKLDLVLKYYYGTEGVKEDRVTAARLAREAINNGVEKIVEQKDDVDAMFRLGSCYHNGIGVTRDYEKAVYWYRKAAEKGHREAQVCFGCFYMMGNGVPIDLDKARYWIRSAAAQGSSTAVRLLQQLNQR